MNLDISKELNQAQYKAATTIDVPVLVIAGAGSGKTRVIEYRSLHLVQSGVQPQSVLLLTFTRKASKEMMTRAAKHDPRCHQIDGGTFHSFAYRILKRYASRLSFSHSFSILDSSDSAELIGKCVSEIGLYDLAKRFPKKETLLSIISKSINKQTGVSTILEREYPQFEELAQEIAKVKKIYTKAKIQSNYMDYDDLLVYLKLILEEDRLREKIAAPYQHFMVDEYQDTNKLQGDITYLLAKDHGTIMAVGDDAQSIYGFRGASHANIMEFPIRFPNCKVIKLEENYRSTQEILDLGNAVLETMKEKYAKNLYSTKEEEGLKPKMLFFKNAYDEAAWVATQVKKLRDDGIALGNQAVLFRSAYISIPLQAELGKLGIPFQVFGGMKFYETAHVKDMVAHLKMVVNFKDELAWLRALNLLEGVGPKTAERIFAFVAQCSSLDEAIEVVRNQFGSGNKYSGKLVQLADTLYTASHHTQTLGEKFRTLLAYYEPLLKKTYDEWQLRLSDLDTLADISGQYASSEEFLADLALEPPERGVEEIDPAFEDERPLTLSTIHSAKGLEWDTVFVIGMIDGVFPSRFSFKFQDQVEEEQRLFYVAVTRPKRELFLTMHHEGSSGGFYQFNRVSRFLEHPSVLRKIEQDLVNTEEITLDPVLTRDEMAGKITDKKTLFEKLNDSWKW